MQSIVHILKKGTHYWRSNHSHCPRTVIRNNVESMFDFHHAGQFGEHRPAGFAKLRPCAPVSPPPPPPPQPQRTTLPSGGMLNQHVDFSLTCIWTHGLYWEILPDISFFFFLRKSAHPVRDFIALGNPLATLSSTASHWLTELMRTSDTAVMAFQISSPAESEQCTGVVFFYMSVVLLMGVADIVLGPPTAQLID